MEPPCWPELIRRTPTNLSFGRSVGRRIHMCMYIYIIHSSVYAVRYPVLQARPDLGFHTAGLRSSEKRVIPFFFGAKTVSVSTPHAHAAGQDFDSLFLSLTRKLPSTHEAFLISHLFPPAGNPGHSVRWGRCLMTDGAVATLAWLSSVSSRRSSSSSSSSSSIQYLYFVAAVFCAIRL